MTFRWPENPAAVEVKNPSKDLADGAWNYYRAPDIEKSQFFDPNRVVIFVNGMMNSSENHAESAVALSELQMCLVIGVYNLSRGFWRDFGQCIADKNQFNGPVSLSARNKVRLGSAFKRNIPRDVAISALGRNLPQQRLFDILEHAPTSKTIEIFAHSQGNLIVSNVMQALAAVYGETVVGRYVVHTFGSPAVNWPKLLEVYRHAYTFDPVSWLAGAEDNISKVGLPQGSINPFTHGFAEYVKLDPIFVVNRYRTGGWGMTFDMDETGLANALARMGTNMPRVHGVFRRLKEMHGSDSDDVAELYVDKIRDNTGIKAAIKAHGQIRTLLMELLGSGVVFPGEQRAIKVLEGL